MSETDLRIETTPPPTEVVLEAVAIRELGTAGRVKVEPADGGGWRVLVDGEVARGRGGPPTDVPADQWDSPDPLDEGAFSDFSEKVRSIATSRKQVTDNFGRGNSPDHWRITLNYDA